MWKFTSYLMGSGKFSTGTGFLGLSVSNHLYKDQVTGIRVAKNDALGTNLEQWLIFFDPGSIIFIRAVNDPQQVAYYKVDSRIDSFNNNTEVRYIVTYIDGDGTPSTGTAGENEFQVNKEYYVGFVFGTQTGPY